MRVPRIALGLSFFGALTLAAIAAFADPPSPPPGPPPHGPPPEAFTACEGKAESAACSVDFHGETLTGSCHAWKDSRLFCLPTNLPPPPPPPSGSSSGGL